MPVIQKTEYETLDTGVYPATVRDVELTEGKFGPQLVWNFDLVEGGSQRGWTGTGMSAKSKLGKWVQALLGTIPDELDTEELVGKACRLSLTIKVNDDGSEWNRVDAVLAARANGKKAPKPLSREQLEEWDVDDEEPPSKTEAKRIARDRARPAQAEEATEETPF